MLLVFTTTCYCVGVGIVVPLLLPTVQAYVSNAPSGGGYDSNLHRIQQQQQQEQSSPWFVENKLVPPTNMQVEDIFREEYHDWALRHNKMVDNLEDASSRYENFKVNFMLQMQHNKKTGIFYLLNEYGDLTATEYHQLMYSLGTNHNNNPNNEKRTTTDASKEEANAAFQNNNNNNEEGITDGQVINRRSRKSGNRKQSQEDTTSSATFYPTSPKSLWGGGTVSSDEPVVNDRETPHHQQFMDGITSPPKVFASPNAKEQGLMKEKQHDEYSAVVAELVVEPEKKNKGESKVVPNDDDSSDPRIKPIQVEAMGVQKGYSASESSRKRPATLESKCFHKTTGGSRTSSYTKKSRFATGMIGTQVVGLSSHKRFVRWEPGMEDAY